MVTPRVRRREGRLKCSTFVWVSPPLLRILVNFPRASSPLLSLSLHHPPTRNQSERRAGSFLFFFSLYDYRYLGGAGDDVEVRRVFVILTAQTEAFGPDPEPEFRRVGSIRSVLSF